MLNPICYCPMLGNTSILLLELWPEGSKMYIYERLDALKIIISLQAAAGIICAMYYLRMYLRVHARACVCVHVGARLCVGVCMWVRARACVCMWVHVCACRCV